MLPEAKQQVTKGHKATLLAKYRSEYEKAQLCPNPTASASQNIAPSEGKQLAQAVMSRKNGILIASRSEPHVYTYIYKQISRVAMSHAAVRNASIVLASPLALKKVSCSDLLR